MTIKQTGGIFGRNTDIQNAEIEDLTVTGSSTLSGAFSVQGTTGLLKQGAAGNVLQIARGMNTDSAVVQIGGNRTGDGSTYIDMFGTSGATFGTRLIRNAGTNGTTFLQTKGTGSLVVRTDDAADVVVQTGGAEAARFNTSGNLAFPSGQGIDFSATAGTGTSELFDDYEEGTFTPAYSFSSPGTGSFGTSAALGFYTKIGNTVYIRIDIRINSFSKGTASGTPLISGLPFTSKNDSGYASAVLNINTSSAVFSSQPSASVPSNAAFLYLTRLVSNAGNAALDDADADAIYFITGTYQAA